MVFLYAWMHLFTYAVRSKNKIEYTEFVTHYHKNKIFSDPDRPSFAEVCHNFTIVAFFWPSVPQNGKPQSSQ